MLDDLTKETNGATKEKNRSVQARAEGSEMFDTPGSGTAGLWGDSFFFHIANAADSFPAWQQLFPLLRDRALRRFYKTEPICAGAVYSMTARIKSLDYNLDGPPRAKKYFQTVLDDCEAGRGYRALIGKFITDVLTQDNGGFIELVGTGDPRRPLRGPLVYPYLMHIDSQQAWRTFDEEWPVVYIDPLTSEYHLMHKSRVVFAASHEQPNELARNIGFCPVSRALHYIQFMRDVLTYKREKTSGSFRRGIIYGKGVNNSELAAHMKAADEKDEAQGFSIYKGMPIIARVNQDVMLDVLDLASLPDSFDTEKDMTLYVYALALAFGVDAREFWPATASGATKADATVQHLKAQGKGIGDLIEIVETAMRAAAPDSVEFECDYTDDEADLRKAEINKARVEWIGSLKDKGFITATEGRRLAIKENVLPVDVLDAVDAQSLEVQGVNDTTSRDLLEVEVTEDPLPIEAQPVQQTTPMQNTQQGQTQVVDPKEEQRQKELAATEAAFISAFDNVLEGAIAGDYSRSQAQNQLYRLIQRYGPAAYIDGMQQGGVEVTSVDDLGRDDLRTIASLLAQQNAFIQDFMNNVYSDSGISPAIAASRGQVWFNGSIMPFNTAGMLAADINAMMEFTGDDGEKPCATCLRLKGQRHRFQEWVDKGFNPPYGINLECSKGKQCKHRLEKVRGRARGGW